MKAIIVRKGGRGSGNFDHEGRPGLVGGSSGKNYYTGPASKYADEPMREVDGLKVPKKWIKDSFDQMSQDSVRRITTKAYWVMPSGTMLDVNMVNEKIDGLSASNHQNVAVELARLNPTEFDKKVFTKNNPWVKGGKAFDALLDKNFVRVMEAPASLKKSAFTSLAVKTMDAPTLRKLQRLYDSDKLPSAKRIAIWTQDNKHVEVSLEDFLTAKFVSVDGDNLTLKQQDTGVIRFKGGRGSGNFGHAGRPGLVGGSATVRLAGAGAPMDEVTALIKKLPKAMQNEIRERLADRNYPYSTPYHEQIKNVLRDMIQHYEDNYGNKKIPYKELLGIRARAASASVLLNKIERIEQGKPVVEPKIFTDKPKAITKLEPSDLVKAHQGAMKRAYEEHLLNVKDIVTTIQDLEVSNANINRLDADVLRMKSRVDRSWEYRDEVEKAHKIELDQFSILEQRDLSEPGGLKGTDLEDLKYLRERLQHYPQTKLRVQQEMDNAEANYKQAVAARDKEIGINHTLANSLTWQRSMIQKRAQDAVTNYRQSATMVMNHYKAEAAQIRKQVASQLPGLENAYAEAQAEYDRHFFISNKPPEMTTLAWKTETATAKKNAERAAAAIDELWAQALSHEEPGNITIPMSMANADNPKLLAKSKEAAVKAFNALVGRNPFLEIHGIESEVKAGSGRAHASGNRITIFGKSLFDQAGIIIHEAGHVLEHVDPFLASAVNEFFGNRYHDTADKEAGGNVSMITKQLKVLTGNSAYEDDEVAFKDNFIDAYMGKLYHGLNMHTGFASTEIVSMGLQTFHDKPNQFATIDPEYFDFMYAVTRLRGN